jgi:hypothetical protein
VETGPSQSRSKRRPKLNPAAAAAVTLGLAWAGAATADDQASGTPATPPAAGAPATPAPPAAPAAPAANPMPFPAMSATLAANGAPAVFDAGPILGKIMVDGVLSGTALWQSNPQLNFYGRPTHDNYEDVSNAQVIVNKTDGPVQFYIQAGTYSIAALGTPEYMSGTYDRKTFGFVPQGFLKLVPNSSFSIEIGALPTLIGDEYTFSFENYNIERGLLWGQEPAVSKGVQGNYTNGPWAISLAWTDGYYSDTYTAISGLITYTFKNSDTLTFAGEGQTGTSRRSSFVTPEQQNNGQIYNLIYTHTQGPWTISPYVQYSNSPNKAGVSSSGSTWGAAVLTKYSFTLELSLAGRVEYTGSNGAANLLGYGVNSNAWSITVTPTYKKGIFFVRGELSYVAVGSGAPGFMFNSDGLSSNQTRAVAEAGLIF